MVTNLSDMTIYILDDDDSGDADTIDLDNIGSQGTNWCSIPLDGLVRGSADQKGQAIQFWGGDGYMLRYDSVLKIIQATGKPTSRAELGYIDKFFHKRVGAGSDPDYLVVYFSDAGNDFLPAYDNNGTDKNGIFRGWFKKIPSEMWTPDENLLHTVTIEFHVVWS